jgi:hypothetical protein
MSQILEPIAPKVTLPLIIGAGLLDGINPCAFAVLVFLLTFLLTVSKDKRRMIKAGVAYVVGVYVTYFLAGLGLLTVIHLTGFSGTAVRLAGVPRDNCRPHQHQGLFLVWQVDKPRHTEEVQADNREMDAQGKYSCGVHPGPARSDVRTALHRRGVSSDNRPSRTYRNTGNCDRISAALQPDVHPSSAIHHVSRHKRGCLPSVSRTGGRARRAG